MNVDQSQIDKIPYWDASFKNLNFSERKRNNNMIYVIMAEEDDRIIGYMKDENARDYFINRPKNQGKY